MSPKLHRSGTATSTLDALFVDVGSTLLRAQDSVGEQYGAFARECGVQADADEIQRRFSEVFHRRRIEARAERALAYGTTEGESRRFWLDVVREVFEPWRPGPAQLQSLFENLYSGFAHADAWQVFPDGLALLDAAHRAGVPCVVVSNWDARLPALLESTGLRQHFAAVVASYEVGAEKPDPTIFEVAINRLAEQGVRVDRARVVHVGDSEEEDVQGARAAGIVGLHLDRPGAYPPEPHRIRTLHEVAARWF